MQSKWWITAKRVSFRRRWVPYALKLTFLIALIIIISCSIFIVKILCLVFASTSWLCLNSLLSKRINATNLSIVEITIIKTIYQGNRRKKGKHYKLFRLFDVYVMLLSVPFPWPTVVILDLVFTVYVPCTYALKYVKFGSTEAG